MQHTSAAAALAQGTYQAEATPWTAAAAAGNLAHRLQSPPQQRQSHSPQQDSRKGLGQASKMHPGCQQSNGLHQAVMLAACGAELVLEEGGCEGTAWLLR